MTPFPLVIEQDWMVRACRSLKACGHFASVHRIAARVLIPRDEHNGRIERSFLYTMVRRVSSQVNEVVFSVCGAEFIREEMGKIKSVVPQHVQERTHANHRTEKVRPLRESCPHEETGIRPSTDCELSSSRITLCDKPLSGGNEIVECSLTVMAFGSAMPFGAELPTTTHVRKGEQEAVLYEKSGVSIELRGTANAKSSIRTQECGQGTRHPLAFLRDQKHRDFRAIF